MCNFTVRKLNRGAVIFGLPDNSGKARPMVLLTDVKPNGSLNYGMTLNAFQIGSTCYNKFDIPIKIQWDSEEIPYNRVCFISVLHTMQFSQSELFRSKHDFIGILPEEILDLAYRAYTTYIRGISGNLRDIAEEIKNMRMLFMKENDIEFIDYRASNADTIRLFPNGDEVVITPAKPKELLTENRSARAIIGKDIKRINRKPQDMTEEIPEQPIEEVVVKEEIPATKKSQKKKIVLPKKKKRRKKDSFGWCLRMRVENQSNDALKNYLNAMHNMKTTEIAEISGIAQRSVYARYDACRAELYRRYDNGSVQLSDDELTLLLKIEEGGGSVEVVKEVVNM